MKTALKLKPEPVPPLHPGAKIRLLIGDDHAVVRDGLVSMIARCADMTVLADGKDGAELVALWQLHHPDVTLMDLRMPGLDGVGAIKAIRSLDFTAKIIILTTFDDDENIYKAVSAGAKGYLLKDAPREEILQCIRKVYQGETCLPPNIVTKLTNRMGQVELTARELMVLKAIASGQSNKEIGTRLFISEETVKAHLKKIFAKLDVQSRTEAVAAASRRGMIQLS